MRDELSRVPPHLCCPDGSHMAMYDDQVAYLDAIIDVIRNV